MNYKTAIKTISLIIILMIPMGCTEEKILKNLQVYFPNASLINDQPNIIHVQTNIHGVSYKFIDVSFQIFVREFESYGIAGNLSSLIEGKNIIIIEFDNYVVEWEIGTNNKLISPK